MIWLLAILSSYRIHKRHTILQISVSNSQTIECISWKNVFIIVFRFCKLFQLLFKLWMYFLRVHCVFHARLQMLYMLWLRFVVNLAMQGLARRGFWFAIVLCSSALVVGIWPSVKSEGMEVVCCFQLISHRILNSDLILGFQYATMQWIWREPQLYWCLCCARVKANDIMIWNCTFLPPKHKANTLLRTFASRSKTVTWYRVDPYWNLWHHMKSKNC